MSIKLVIGSSNAESNSILTILDTIIRILKSRSYARSYTIRNKNVKEYYANGTSFSGNIILSKHSSWEHLWYLLLIYTLGLIGGIFFLFYQTSNPNYLLLIVVIFPLFHPISGVMSGLSLFNFCSLVSRATGLFSDHLQMGKAWEESLTFEDHISGLKEPIKSLVGGEEALGCLHSRASSSVFFNSIQQNCRTEIGLLSSPATVERRRSEYNPVIPFRVSLHGIALLPISSSQAIFATEVFSPRLQVIETAPLAFNSPA
ncbi:hypothetical protein M9H77_12210 [Catharanthus roseus]|uniref:Uncharacterized protein n=1 Tax=Catharanthus roseus TaxID=4058 RepID=A0ACC0BGW1_CATRO|nr:hypothetical protein M9H77_12210 [Catharanthus roseus]